MIIIIRVVISIIDIVLLRIHNVLQLQKNNTSYIIPGYQFDINTSVCSPQNWLILGMDVKDWHFLEALTGLLFGVVFMIFTIILFMQAGKEK